MLDDVFVRLRAKEPVVLKCAGVPGPGDLHALPCRGLESVALAGVDGEAEAQLELGRHEMLHSERVHAIGGWEGILERWKRVAPEDLGVASTRS